MTARVRHIAILLTAATAPAASSAQAQADPPYRYTVKAHDTFSDLAVRYLAADRNWRDLRALTRVRDPRRLPTGLEIAIPMAWLRASNEPARFASFRGAVTVEIGTDRQTARLGMAIEEGASITTGPNSFATLVLADRSRLSLPSQTRVRVVSLRRLLIDGSVDYRLKLEQGRVDTQVSPITQPHGRYRIDTPTIMTTVRGTEYRVSYDPASAAGSAEILDGVVQVAPAERGAMRAVARGQGVVADHGALSAFDLLAAPALQEPGKLQTDDHVRFALMPVEGAARYRAVLATDAGFIDRYADAVAGEPLLDLGPLPNGTHFIKLSAIAANGLEGHEQSYAFRRLLASIHPGAVDRDADSFRFRWSGAGDGPRRYRFQLIEGEPGRTPIVDQVGLTVEEASVKGLHAGTYHWRVGLTQTSSEGQIDVWTPYNEFIIGEPERRRTAKQAP